MTTVAVVVVAVPVEPPPAELATAICAVLENGRADVAMGDDRSVQQAIAMIDAALDGHHA